MKDTTTGVDYAEMEEEILRTEALKILHLNKPKGYFTIKDTMDGCSYRHPTGFIVVNTVSIVEGEVWQHVSYSRPNKMPTHSETLLVKRDFVGEDKYAYAVFPPKDMYVNIHKFCLHLWVCHTKNKQLPEFSGIVKGLGRSI